MEYVQLKENTLRVTREPLAGTSLTNLMRLLLENRFNIDGRYLPRLLYAMTISGLATPLRIKEHLQFDSTIKKTEIEHHPLFILGHWRSGTTYLHNLLSLDATRGYVSTLHALIPDVFLGSGTLVNSIVTKSLPNKRPMDDVSMGSELPQEDEFALAALCPYSPNHELCFPRNWTYYNRYIYMDDVPQTVKDAWKTTYRYLLQKETLSCGGKQLILKNPSNTARVNLLLEMFPNAKFIHIYRNPYHVYRSMMKLILSIVPYMCLQQPPTVPIVENQVLQVYKRIYIKYLNERGNIPQKNLIEVRYEDFIQRPLEYVKDIYSRLELDGFQASENKFKDYVASQEQMKKQQYTLDEQLKERIHSEWKFTFDAFHYEK
jgi:hypothetical protein